MNVAIIIVAVAALALAAWLRAAGSAITRVPRADALRDEADGVRGAGIVAELLEEREAITPAVAMVGSALLVMAAVAATALVTAEQTLGTAIAYAAIVFLVVFLLGDLAPRQLGRRRPRSIAYRSARLLAAAVSLGGWASDLITESNGDEEGEIEPEPETVTEQEREMIDSVLEFGDTVVREVMTPRPDMVTVPVTATVDDLISVTTDEGFSRIPVTSNGDVVGMVMVKDLLPLLGEGRRPASVAEVMRPVEFVPETKLASALLGEMQANHQHQMIVVDEYGEVAGLVTIEDLLEELVGEIADETDEEEIFISARRDGGWDVDGRLPVDDLARLAGVDLPDEDWDTVAGLVMGLAERVPDEGEQFSHGPLTLTVTRMQGRRVADVSVSVSEAVDAE
ncbi:MAG: HlyC/CorC family transporter [Acidimicrobiia bacterium]|nr:HlyC/CorC family transporter [Acidimicrobiia bacterium]